MEKIKEMLAMNFPLFINILMSIVAYFATSRLIPSMENMFIKANLYGVDMNKKSTKKVPEALGVVSGCAFLVTMFLFIPIPFSDYILKNADFQYSEFIDMLAALLSICCMVLLGFADDVLDLRWRHKLLLPTVASLPLLMVYFVNFNSTLIIVPKPLRAWFGFSVNLYILYYVYMGMLAVFCTNAINILAGINGLEVGQSLIISISIIIFNAIELTGDMWKAHIFSMYFLIPYTSTSLALLKYNWYPSQVFVGDTFCYLSGMTFAVVGIIGHFSKTTLLFFIPQILNFVYSVPQLFHLVPCPRHRLPKINKETDTLDPSKVVFNKSELNIVAKLIMRIYRIFRIVEWKEDGDTVICNNLTLINFVLILTGPKNERTLTTILIVIQIICSVLAFTIRYPLASLFYDV
ncbi:UDP-N-acetylglucosamine--dolichyl-phosphate N-acetylglucosaminephosphotransferase [Leptopilina heterotoma]|uniref:UDP-N-acetylglucosamine--dolichyl-phosphate N-acetylglucosaminephosphotransferase n=1 Tax=Leptopilina heterotoma TaxID=63436 RepID=UPI001CA7C2B0|nr:UDP-N-acetylglucosamine--dolichyl-phosphate N-acetylglucosaminephosphotransferase [Leptopilina heterotoma]XP_043478393.1 UDP-N-acetylglucosamine--dolichyl-phosphate N-acetylglucosaminephosphotransferase [Leptopilina heterotoma]